MKKNNNAVKYIIWGIVLMFIPFLSVLGFILLLVGLIMLNKSNDSNTIELNKEDITQDEIHAHDFKDVQKEDFTQDEIHAHDSWDNEGPIKYYK